MKKIIALLLCLLMIVGMVACATNTDNNDQTDGSQDTTPATENPGRGCQRAGRRRQVPRRVSEHQG